MGFAKKFENGQSVLKKNATIRLKKDYLSKLQGGKYRGGSFAVVLGRFLTNKNQR